ncbi:MAG: hypothetical protein ACLUD2_12380 [Clostridium sp.]
MKLPYLPVDHDGASAWIGRCEEALRPDTILVSTMYVNNEVGAVDAGGEDRKACS